MQCHKSFVRKFSGAWQRNKLKISWRHMTNGDTFAGSCKSIKIVNVPTFPLVRQVPKPPGRLVSHVRSSCFTLYVLCKWLHPYRLIDCFTKVFSAKYWLLPIHNSFITQKFPTIQYPNAWHASSQNPLFNNQAATANPVYNYFPSVQYTLQAYSLNTTKTSKNIDFWWPTVNYTWQTTCSSIPLIFYCVIYPT